MAYRTRGVGALGFFSNLCQSVIHTRWSLSAALYPTLVEDSERGGGPPFWVEVNKVWTVTSLELAWTAASRTPFTTLRDPSQMRSGWNLPLPAFPTRDGVFIVGAAACSWLEIIWLPKGKGLFFILMWGGAWRAWSQVTLVCSQRLENHCQRVTQRGWSISLSVSVFSGPWDSRFVERKWWNSRKPEEISALFLWPKA